MELFGTTYLRSAAPMSVAPATAPSYEYWLKFLSLTVPTSVTTPILSDTGVGVGDAPAQAAAMRESETRPLSPIARVRMRSSYACGTTPTPGSVTWP